MIMNPPFSHKRDIAHIQHAWKFLQPGGTLVAIASAGVKYRSDAKTHEFRTWLDRIGASVTENGAIFEDTDVNTITIIARKDHNCTDITIT